LIGRVISIVYTERRMSVGDVNTNEQVEAGVDDDEVGEDQMMASEVMLAHARCRPDGIGVTLRLKRCQGGGNDNMIGVGDGKAGGGHRP
jgi:hypothetical protein